MSQQICASLRVKLFNSTVLPVFLYGLSSLALKPMHDSMLKGKRLKMLRNMAGWRRIEGESWQGTMRRMRQRVNNLQTTGSSPDVSQEIFSLKWRLARRLLTGSSCEKWAPLLLQLLSLHSRPRGRPPTQWLDDFSAFSTQAGEGSLQMAPQRPELEEECVQFCM